MGARGRPTNKPGRGRPAAKKQDGEKKEKNDVRFSVQVTPASSASWSMCKQCQNKFKADELRIAFHEVTATGTAFTSNYWHHFDCLKSTRTRPWRYRVSSAVEVEGIEGYDVLPPTDQEALQAFFQTMRAENYLKDDTQATSSKLPPHITEQQQGTSSGPRENVEAEKRKESPKHESLAKKLRIGGEENEAPAESDNSNVSGDSAKETNVVKSLEKVFEVVAKDVAGLQSATETVHLDAVVLSEAQKKGLHKKLAAMMLRPEVAAKGIQAVFAALQTADGNVPAAKHLLQGTKQKTEYTPPKTAKATTTTLPLPADAPKSEDTEILSEAKKKGLSTKLGAIMARPEILAKGVDLRAALTALENADGKVPEAKRALLSHTVQLNY